VGRDGLFKALMIKDKPDGSAGWHNNPEMGNFRRIMLRIWTEHNPQRKNADSGWAGMTDGFT
jgi:hypothetical protein